MNELNELLSKDNLLWNDICLSKRHDFGLLDGHEQASVIQSGIFWLQAIIKELEYRKYKIKLERIDDL